MDFSLFAPYLEKVDLITSWSKHPIPMQQQPSGLWLAREDVPDGVHLYKFAFQSLSPFLRRQMVQIADPKAKRIDKTSNSAVLHIENRMDITSNYQWQFNHVPLPQNNHLVIYELHIAEFARAGRKSGTFLTLIQKLDYLQDLGVNAIELMPIMAFGSLQSWGYNPRHACAIEPSYGTPQDFKRLVDACHQRGMRVILDMVFNHSDVDAPLTKIDFNYWYRQARKGELSFGPKLDYERYDPNLRIFPARDFSLEVAKHWITEYNIDGFRLDATRVLDNFDFLWALRGVAQQAARGKPFYLVAEHLGEDPAVANHGPADGAWHHGFMQEVLAHIKNERYDPNNLLAQLQPRFQGYAQPELVCHYLETHDELPLMRQLGQAKIFGSEALQRHKLAATLLFTAVGNPMLHQGQEFGEYRPKSLKIRRLNWKLEAASYGQAIKAHYKHLARLRRGSSGLMGSDFRIYFVDARTGIVAFARGYGQAKVMVLANLKNQAQPLRVPFPNGAWHERLFGYQVGVTDGVLVDFLEPFAAKIFMRR